MGWPSHERTFALADVSGCIPNHLSDLREKFPDTLIRRAGKDGNQDPKTRENTLQLSSLEPRSKACYGQPLNDTQSWVA